MKTWGLGYKKSLEKAKRIYSKIGRIKCPALNNENISFSRLGFNHLVRKGRIPRTRNEQKRRFVLLPYTEKIIKNPKANISFLQKTVKNKVDRHGEKILVESTASFWTFIERVNSCKIKVVIRQLNHGDKHFFSVMGNSVHVKNKKKIKKPLKK